MSKPITRRTSRPIMIAASPSNLLEKRIAILEEKVDRLLARPTTPARTATPILDEAFEHALEARLQALGQDIEAAAAQRAIAALDPKVDEVVAAKTKNVRPAFDPRTLVELVDQRLKEALEHRFRAMLGHIEADVIPRVLRKNASGI